MKKLISQLILVAIAGICQAQFNEFKTYSNGLIYDTTTMKRLGSIVDSLNLRFRACDLSHPYYALEQGLADIISIPSKKAEKLVSGGISLGDYLKKYPDAVQQANTWVVKFRYADYNDRKVIKYSGLPQGYSGKHSMVLKYKPSHDKAHGWIINKDGDMAYYLKGLQSMEIPYEYARYVQYVDCMIDTTAEVFLPVAKAETYQFVAPGSDGDVFIQWAEKYPGKPEHPGYDENISDEVRVALFNVYHEQYQMWDSLRLISLDNKMTPYWKSKLMDARDEAVKKGNSDERLEYYVQRYLSKSDALKMKRSRRVMGGCSMDLSPRYHAMSISTLAAETARWDIFLRSHLDVMNDRFERVSDGSYAWQGRKTYLKELEELDINAIDLLLGICLRVKNVSDNHYEGSIGRVGRALSDAENKKELETQIFSMIKDERLDPYNRLIFAYVLDNYAYNLDDKLVQKVVLSQLELAIMNWPPYLQEVWDNKD
ncbi:hypothetical protein FNH22_29965 [Fulvivirga sp. M361]|uniref:hypothetical protein n=1 Tax=Fulvivirga sp. M361 TaxID=2594266 RepID=UPI00117AC934|nr:hypothetical protein [Fulvivirga sp. M361]TRX47999.1 hypothetical protein FNH22_29965 [Fulvivirga sp. M361]